VGNLSMPDPRVTNPELFDLRNPDAPIPQFVNAMNMAGIEVTKEQVLEALQNPRNYQTFKDTDGNLFVVATYPLNNQLIPLFGASSQNNEIKWDDKNSASLRILGKINNIDTGTMVLVRQIKDPRFLKALKEFNSVLIDWHFSWENTEPKQGEYNFSQPNKLINFANAKRMNIIGQHLVWGADVPDWLKNGRYSKDELKGILRNHIINLVKFGDQNGIKLWTVVNEVGNNDFWLNNLGEEYVKIAFETFVQNTNAKGLLSDYGNDMPGKRYQTNLRLINQLIDEGIPKDRLGVGLHMRVNAANPPKEEELIKLMRSYGGVDVYITELTVDLSNVSGPPEQRFLKQSEIYQTIMRAALKSGVVKGFYVYGIGDNWNFLETDPDYKKPNADPSLYFDDYSPKPAVFYLRAILLESILNYNQP